MIEREKRYTLSSQPPSNLIIESFTISQTYAHFNPDVRIRKTSKNDSDTHYHTVKYNLPDGTREELEHKISQDRYAKIYKSIGKKPITKQRTIVELDNGLKAEVDEFRDSSKTIIEVEFPTEESMNTFVPPDWFGNEIKPSKNGKSFSMLEFERINNIRHSVWDEL